MATPIGSRCKTGISDGEWIEVTNRRAPGYNAASTGDLAWTPIDGTEKMILGNLSILNEGGRVTIAPASDSTKSALGAPGHGPTNAKPTTRLGGLDSLRDSPKNEATR